MICTNCKNIVVLHAFSSGECTVCKEVVNTGHIPCYKVCLECSEELHLCQQCGKPLALVKS